jgi:hypothetical protein
MSELAFASGGLALAISMGLDLAADRSAVFSHLRSYTSKTPAEGECSLDQKPVIIGEMFHSKSFPAGYKCNFN